MLGAALQHARVLLGEVADQDALGGADHAAAVLEALLVQAGLEDLQALLFHVHRRVVVQVGRRGAGAGAVDEGVGKVEAHILNQFHGLLEVALGFTREADDKVGAEDNVRHRSFELADARLVFQRSMVALHRRQDAVGARLHRQMQVFHQFRDLGVGLDDGVREFQRVAGGVANAFDAVDGGNRVQQVGKVGAVKAVAVDVLAQQGNFLDAVFSQVNDFAQHIGQWAADFFATGVGHHAETAVLAAAFHDRDKGGRAVYARLWQRVELFDLGEADVHLRLVSGARSVDHLGQAVQGLRAEDHVDVGGAVADGGAFLTGDAAANADDQLGILLFQRAPASQLGKDLFLRLLADRAGVEQDDIRLVGVVGQLHCLVVAEQVCHARAVILVHLAAVGLDKEFLGHGSVLGCWKKGRLYTQAPAFVMSAPVL